MCLPSFMLLRHPNGSTYNSHLSHRFCTSTFNSSPKGLLSSLASVHLPICLSVPIILVNTITQSVYPIHPPNLQGGFDCRIKTGHSNFVSCFGPRMRALAKVFYRGVSEVKYRASARIRGAKPDTRFEWPVSILIITWYLFLPFQNHKTSAKIPVFLQSPAPLDSAVPVSAHPPHFECTNLLLRSADWWRHNILLSIARTMWILSECKLSTDNHVDY